MGNSTCPSCNADITHSGHRCNSQGPLRHCQRTFCSSHINWKFGTMTKADGGSVSYSGYQCNSCSTMQMVTSLCGLSQPEGHPEAAETENVIGGCCVVLLCVTQLAALALRA